jgi:hypothetical protein
MINITVIQLISDFVHFSGEYQLINIGTFVGERSVCFLVRCMSFIAFQSGEKNRRVKAPCAGRRGNAEHYGDKLDVTRGFI